jgi:hypothetical protein
MAPDYKYLPGTQTFQPCRSGRGGTDSQNTIITTYTCPCSSPIHTIIKPRFENTANLLVTPSVNVSSHGRYLPTDDTYLNTCSSLRAGPWFTPPSMQHARFRSLKLRTQTQHPEHKGQIASLTASAMAMTTSRPRPPPPSPNVRKQCRSRIYARDLAIACR